MMPCFWSFGAGGDEGGKMAQDFGDADDGDFRIVGDDFNARGTHAGATHAEEGDHPGRDALVSDEDHERRTGMVE